ncbi:MAG TPA: amidohydrolase family protein, partial [Chitinophagaceae bacterium]|nr:amidohydrolase family protein [Chitinophagaceae bacterium]
VRDMGNMPYIRQLQQSIRQHDLIGPDISYLSGFIDKDDEYHGPVGKLVHTKKEAVKAVDDFKKEGYDQIKIYSSIDTGWVTAMTAEAHKNNMRVAGHIPEHMTASQAVKKGYNEITHLVMVMLNFLPDTIDTRRNRLRPIGEMGYTIDLKSRLVKDFIKLLKEKKIVVEPTINNYADMFNTAPGDTNVFYKPVTSWNKKRNFIVNSFIDDTLKIPAYKRSYIRMVEMVKLLYDNGVQLLAGSDDAPPFAIQLELELFVKAGIPANEVLKIATYTPAKIFNLDTRYGSIQKNRVADFILVDGDPLVQISDIRRVFMVVTNHRLYYPKKLYKYADWDYYY